MLRFLLFLPHLQARADEAAAELAGVKERYREVLEKLEAELDHSATLEVRGKVFDVSVSQ